MGPKESLTPVVEVDKHGSDNWYTDTSKEAQRARRIAEFSEANEFFKKGRVVEDLRKFIDDAHPTPHEIYAELQKISINARFNDKDQIKLIIEVYLHLPKEKTTTIVKDKLSACLPVLKLLCADRRSEMILLNSIEEFIEVKAQRLLSLTGVIIQSLYESAVVDEDSINEWFDSLKVKSAVKEKMMTNAKVFVLWLREAEAEVESD